MEKLGLSSPLEGDADREARAREDAIVAKGTAEIAAGLGIDGDDVTAWFATLDQDENAPPPIVAHQP